MARGTKTYTTGKIRSTRLNKIILTYFNVDPAGTFQSGDYAFAQEYFEPETDSLDCLADTTDPITFTFLDQTGLALSTLTVSDVLTLTGFTGIAPVTISGGEYRINGGAWTSAAGTMISGQTLQLRNTTSASNDTTVSTTVTVGTVSDTWTIRTLTASGTAWRVQAASLTCGTGEYEGYVIHTTLEEYTVSTGINTGVTKDNDPIDPDYIPGYYDVEECPLPGVTEYRLTAYSSDSIADACAETTPLSGAPISVYSSISNPLTNKTLYNQPELISAWTSVPTNGDYVKFYVAGTPGTTYVGVVDSGGNMTSIATC